MTRLARTAFARWLFLVAAAQRITMEGAAAATPPVPISDYIFSKDDEFAFQRFFVADGGGTQFIDSGSHKIYVQTPS